MGLQDPTTASGAKLPYLHALVFAHDSSQLQVALDLLADLLEAVHDGHGGDGVDAAQDVQGHVDQALLARDLPVLDDGRGRGVDAQHGVVGAGVVLGAVLIGSHNGWEGKVKGLPLERVLHRGQHLTQQHT